MDSSSSAVNQVSSVAYQVNGGRDEPSDFSGGLSAALRQLTHLCSYYSEAASLFAGTSSLHRRVECQDVGLKCNPIDDTDDVRDPLRRCTDLVHSLHSLTHHCNPMVGNI